MLLEKSNLSSKICQDKIAVSIYLKSFLSPLNNDRALSSPPLMSLNRLRNIWWYSWRKCRRLGIETWCTYRINNNARFTDLHIVYDTGFSVHWCTDLLLFVLAVMFCWLALHSLKLLESHHHPETLSIHTKNWSQWFVYKSIHQRMIGSKN